MTHRLALIGTTLAIGLTTTCLGQVDPPGAAVELGTVLLDEDTLRVHFIDVGGGMAALVETPGGKHILIDGGKRGSSDYRDYVEHFVDGEPIDLLIVTHADDDHFQNMATFIRNFEVFEYVNTGYTSKTLDGLSRWPRFRDEIVPELEDRGMVNWTPIGEFVEPGDFESIDDRETGTVSDDVRLQYLNVDKQPPSIDPDSGRHFNESKRRNNASLVFQIHYHDTSFLFTGDINGRGFGTADETIDSEEAELLARHEQHPTFSLKATVLQVSHHGSDGSSSLPFLEAVDPEWAVIPVGNAHGHPHAGAVDRLEQVVEPDTHILRTDEGSGATDPSGDDSFVFIVDEGGIRAIMRIVVD